MRERHSHNLSQSGGFSLIELLLYISLAGIILVIITSLFSVITRSRVKNRTVLEVERQGLHVTETITQAVRNAESINSPSSGNSASSLSLERTDGAEDPMVFQISDSTIEVTEGGGSATALTNSLVNVSGFSVENLSRANTPGVVKIEFTLSHINLSGRNEYNFEKVFYTSASLRPQN